MGRRFHCTAVRGHRTTGIWLVWVRHYISDTHGVLTAYWTSSWAARQSAMRSTTSYCGRVTQRRAAHRTKASGGFVRYFAVLTGYS
jgi:hypothetical protein